MLLALGSRVVLIGSLAPNRTDRHEGKIIGYGYLHHLGIRPAYLVQLDHGFYDPTGSIYVGTLVVAHDGVHAIKE